MNVACDYEAPMQMLTTEKYIAARVARCTRCPSLPGRAENSSVYLGLSNWGHHGMWITFIINTGQILLILNSIELQGGHLYLKLDIILIKKFTY